ncbi:NUDIX domain-containing protein [Micromonospora fulviviridis]|uniref:NUDIX domain-containing protein n=1 Tax=Micromonospora fulviviridis TaxID=47860 RepID=A0ABV2VVR4_9ACTN
MLKRRQLVAISDSDISRELLAYLECYPDDAVSLSEPMKLLAEGEGFAWRNFSMHVTVGALLVRGGTEVLLVDHLAYEMPLQPGGHLEPADSTLISAAVRELVEETGVDPSGLVPASQMPVYVEYGRVPEGVNLFGAGGSGVR